MKRYAQHLFDALLLTIVTIMPFHAFLSLALGSQFGHQSLIQSWKEVVLVLMCILLLTLQRIPAIVRILRKPHNLAVVAFAVLALSISLVTGIYRQPSFWFGAKTDLGFLLVFILAQFASEHIRRWAVYSFLAASSVVALFGVLQVTVLPVDFLARFGYNSNTIEPYRLVDPAVPGIRILSTLGGPNQLGNFLILPVCLMVYKFMRRQWWWLAGIAAAGYTMWHSYSRSAEISLIAAVAIMVFLYLNRRWQIILASVIVVAGILMALIGGQLIASNKKLQYYLFHGQVVNNEVLGSDAGRLANIQQGIKALSNEPAGQGLGSAGPASYQSDQAIITENYYLQIGIETGILGLLLFALIIGLTARSLYHVKVDQPLALPVLAALLGLSLSNLFLHTWADSSTALTFWAIAGLVLGDNHEVV